MSRPWLAAALAASALVAAGCGSGSDDPVPDQEAKTYTVRGQIVTLPADNNGEIRLAHEAIDDFVSAGGEVVGMDAMTMSFSLAPAATASELAVGDIVEFDLRVGWSSEPLATVTRIEKLLADTELVFGKAEPTGSGED